VVGGRREHGAVTVASRHNRARRSAAVVGVLVAVGVVGAIAIAVARTSGDGAPGAAAFVDIERVPEGTSAPRATSQGSTGTYVARCGRNERGHHNFDNVIVSPHQRGAAQHLHDYVGNVATDASSSNRRLAHAATTCTNGDRSSYYWPVLRALDRPGGEERFGNRGAVLRPASVLVEFRGNTTSKVVPMPRYLRASTGDAHAATQRPPLATARWTCSGHRTRYTPRYPLCPDGEQVVRTFDFPNCWDGRRRDSPDHHSHVVFGAANGVCPRGTFAIPQLHVEVAYAVPSGRSFAVDTFPEERHSARTDHADFVAVMSDALMTRVVTCINGGRHC
jgi:hypothetical protein